MACESFGHDQRRLRIHCPGRNRPNTIFAVTREWRQKNRESVAGYLRAWLKAGAWARDPTDREAAIKLIGAELKLNSQQSAESIDELSTNGNLNLPAL